MSCDTKINMTCEFLCVMTFLWPVLWWFEQYNLSRYYLAKSQFKNLVRIDEIFYFLERGEIAKTVEWLQILLDTLRIWKKALTTYCSILVAWVPNQDGRAKLPISSMMSLTQLDEERPSEDIKHVLQYLFYGYVKVEKQFT